MYPADRFKTILRFLLRKPIIPLVWLILFPMHAVSQDCSVDQIKLQGIFGQVSFEVFIAATPKSREKGLMNITDFPKRRAMLFVYPSSQRVFFWMKNTFIPLDILFADGQGEIVKIHHNAKPHDETLIDSGEDVKFVLEINAGLAKSYGLNIGAKMLHPKILQHANWKCK